MAINCIHTVTYYISGLLRLLKNTPLSNRVSTLNRPQEKEVSVESDSIHNNNSLLSIDRSTTSISFNALFIHHRSLLCVHSVLLSMQRYLSSSIASLVLRK